jgi:hypothetical protein
VRGGGAWWWWCVWLFAFGGGAWWCVVRGAFGVVEVGVVVRGGGAFGYQFETNCRPIVPPIYGGAWCARVVHFV